MVDGDRPVRPRCEELGGETRCQLEAGHDSAHAAHLDGALMSWINWGATNGRRFGDEWVYDVEEQGHTECLGVTGADKPRA